MGSYMLGGLSNGVIDINGVTTTLDVPGSTNTYLVGINDNGVIAGNYTDATGQHGFLANPTPEPGTLSSLCLGLFVLWLFSRKKRNEQR